MKCSKVRDLLIGFVDRTLPADLASTIADHLKECMPCDRDRMEVEKAGEFISAGAPSTDLVAEGMGDLSIVADVMRSIRATPQQEESNNFTGYVLEFFGNLARHPVGALAAAACVLLIVSAVGPQTVPGSEAPLQAIAATGPVALLSQSPGSESMAAIPGLDSAVPSPSPEEGAAPDVEEAENALVQAMYEDIEKEILLDQLINDFQDFNFDPSHLEFDKFVTTAGY